MASLCCSDFASVPTEGYNDVLDAVHHMLHFSLLVHTAGSLDEVADSEYVQHLEWYDEISRVFSGASIR